MAECVVHVCVCVGGFMCQHTCERQGMPWMACSPSLQRMPLRHSLSLTLELGWQSASSNQVFPHLIMLRLQVCAVMWALGIRTQGHMLVLQVFFLSPEPTLKSMLENTSHLSTVVLHLSPTHPVLTTPAYRSLLDCTALFLDLGFKVSVPLNNQHCSGPLQTYTHCGCASTASL